MFRGRTDRAPRSRHEKSYVVRASNSIRGLANSITRSRNAPIARRAGLRDREDGRDGLGRCDRKNRRTRKPVSLHPENPRYFLFRNRPLVLLAATEHYGSVINRAFDFERYLDDAADKHQTMTRTFLLFREQQSARNPSSPCKPESPDFVTSLAANRARPGHRRRAALRPRSMEPRILPPPASVPVAGLGVGNRGRANAVQQYVRRRRLGAQPAAGRK